MKSITIQDLVDVSTAADALIPFLPLNVGDPETLRARILDAFRMADPAEIRAACDGLTRLMNITRKYNEIEVRGGGMSLQDVLTKMRESGQLRCRKCGKTFPEYEGGTTETPGERKCPKCRSPECFAC